MLTRALESLKNVHFNGLLLIKVYNVWDKKGTGRVMFDGNQDWYKVWRKTDLWFGKWHEEFGKFSSEHLRVSKLVLSWDPFVPSRKCMN